MAEYGEEVKEEEKESDSSTYIESRKKSVEEANAAAKAKADKES